MTEPSPSLVSVITPTFDRAAFLPRAIESLQAQSEARWELLVVDDGSTDDTGLVLERFLRDPRIRVRRLPRNVGLGAALNVGLAETTAPYVAYLPSDDLLHRDHLAGLLAVLERDPRLVLAYAGVRHHYNRDTTSTVDGWWQLVQVMHRRVPGERWPEREELVTDDLGAMYWNRLRRHGRVRGTRRVTCEWVQHPDQMTNYIREPLGGVNPFRHRFRVPHPLRFRTSVGDPIDEVAHYARFRDRPPTPPATDGLKILLVGELAYNPERILALEERGHRLYGLWTPIPASFNMVGPVPFGHIQDLPADDWAGAIRRLRPDVIYGLLNWYAVPLAAEVRRQFPEIPFVWHFKEGPFICRERGTWADLVELTRDAHGVIHSSREMGEWFETFVPGSTDPERTLVLDGDLPKADWFAGARRARRRLSDVDGEIHTVVPGRPIGLHPPDVAALAANGIHLHFYGRVIQGLWTEWIEKTRRLAPRHLHIHPTVTQQRWVQEFSRYDAGWLHVFRSRNGGDIRAADWDDLNVPARMATVIAAGLPVIQGRNDGAVVATQTLARDLGVGIFYRETEELAAQLRDGAAMRTLAATVASRKHELTFDAHADRLVDFFRRTIGRAQHRPSAVVARR